jgi:hypothetical protein
MTAAKFPPKSLKVIEFHAIKFNRQKGYRRVGTGGNQNEMAADSKMHNRNDMGEYFLDAKH